MPRQVWRRLQQRLLPIAPTLALVLVSTASVTTLVTGVFLLRSSQTLARNETALRLKDAAKLVASRLDADAIAGLRGPSQMGTPAYQQAHAALTGALQDIDGVHYIYTVRKAREPIKDPFSRYVFVVDGTPYSNKDFTATGVVMPTSPNTDALHRVWSTGQFEVDRTFVTDQWGTWISGYIPLIRRDGSFETVLGIDISAEHVVKERNQILGNISQSYLFSLLLTLPLAAIAGVLITKPLRDAQQRLQTISRLKEAQTLALLKEKLSSSLQAAAVAHEINQPLSMVLLNSQLLLRQGEGTDLLPAPSQELLHNLATEAQRVVLTIEKMRTLLRNVQTEHQRIDLCEVSRSAVLYAHSATAAAHLGLDSSGLEGEASGPAWIEGDGAQIQIAIVNLLRNACEALVEADVQDPWIGISLRRDGAYWLLALADNGPGFRGDESAAAPLHTTKAEGSGLGLFVVRTTMENHKGTMDLGRSEQGGALVQLRFPAA
jgi:signal transduction histidine kinase